MKKTFFLLIVSLFCFQGIAYADYQIDDFESGNIGWSTVACYYDIRTNTYPGGLNTSTNVLFTNRGTANDNWSGAILSAPVGAPIKGYNYLHVKMYRNNTHVPNVKISDNPAADLVPMNGIVANQWQDVVFDISAYNASGLSYIMLMVDRTATLTAEAWMLVDDIMVSNDATPRTYTVGVLPENGSGETNGYALVWQDLFNTGTLNASNWSAESDCSGGGNSELQCYRPENVSVATDPATGRGCLILTAKKETYNTKPATSGRVNSLNKVSFKHGKIEASIKMPYTANGLWPAFWMLGADIAANPWPACGEIDIMEMGNATGISAGTQSRYYSGACHWGTTSLNHPNYGVASTNSTSLQGDFHLFTLIWDDSSIKMYLDLDKNPAATPYYSMGIPSSTDNTNAGYYFHKPFYILFNLAVGGMFSGIYNIDGITALNAGNAPMYIDYVKVYQQFSVGDAQTLDNNQTTSVYPNPATDFIQANEVMESMTVYNLLGNLVLSAENTNKVDVSALPNGMYIVNLITENGSLKSERFIKK